MSLKKSGSKLFLLLSCLERQEIRDFNKFLRSPYFNKNEVLVQLFERLRPHYPDFPPEKVNKERLSKQILPGEDYKERKMRDYFSDLSLLVIQFLQVQQLKVTPIIQDELLVDAMSQRDEYDTFIREAEQSIKALEERSILTIEEYLHLHRTNSQVFFHPNRPTNNFWDLERVMRDLDQLFLRSKLPMICDSFGKRQSSGVSIEVAFYKPILEYLEQYKEADSHELFHLYYLVIHLYHGPFDEKTFRIACTSFLQKADQLADMDKRSLLTTLINIGFRVTAQGNKKYLRDLWALYKFGVESNLFLVNGLFPEQTYTNIAVLCSSLSDQQDWVQQFIEGYRPFLQSRARRRAYDYARAYLAFMRGNYQLSIDIMRFMRFSGLSYTLRFKSLQFRAWFELDFHKEKDGFSSHLYDLSNAFSSYLRRQEEKGLKARIATYRNFVNYARAIARALDRVTSKASKIKELKELAQQIEQADELFAADWLLDVIERALAR